MTFGTPRVFHKKFKFLVEFDGVNYAGFQKMSAIKASIAKIEYFEGGALLANKDLGRVTVEDVTCERGATQDYDLWNWFVQCANMASQTGAIAPTYKRNGCQVQLDRDGTELKRIPLYGCAPIAFEAGEWDNEADENVIEKVTFMYDRFDQNRIK